MGHSGQRCSVSSLCKTLLVGQRHFVTAGVFKLPKIDRLRPNIPQTDVTCVTDLAMIAATVQAVARLQRADRRFNTQVSLACLAELDRRLCRLLPVSVRYTDDSWMLLSCESVRMMAVLSVCWANKGISSLI